MGELQDQAIRQHCKALRMPTIGAQFARLADAAAREGQSHIGYLEALLAAEMEERETRAITRLLHEARLPRMKTLEAFEFDRSGVSAGQLRQDPGALQCVFRRKAASDSDPFRPLIPTQAGHGFR